MLVLTFLELCGKNIPIDLPVRIYEFHFLDLQLIGLLESQDLYFIINNMAGASGIEPLIRDSKSLGLPLADAP